MSDEQRKDEEAEVEAHRRHLASVEPTAEGESDDDEVEAHVKKATPRHI